MIISLFETTNWPKKKKIRKFRFSSTLSDFATEKNKLIEEIISGNPHKETFGKIMWSRICQIILEG